MIQQWNAWSPSIRRTAPVKRSKIGVKFEKIEMDSGWSDTGKSIS